MANLTGKIIDVTNKPPGSVVDIHVKAPSARVGSGTGAVVSSPAVPIWAAAVGRADGVTSLARVGIGGTGTVTLADTTAPVFASVSYFVKT